MNNGLKTSLKLNPLILQRRRWALSDMDASVSGRTNSQLRTSGAFSSMMNALSKGQWISISSSLNPTSFHPVSPERQKFSHLTHGHNQAEGNYRKYRKRYRGK